MKEAGIRDFRRCFCADFHAAETAVSPVISTILMVAITVVLAATAFVLVAGIGGTATDPAPILGFAKDDAADRLTVTTAGTGADWDRIWLVIKDDKGTDPIHVGNSAGTVNQPATLTGAILAKDQKLDVSATTMMIVGSDALNFCRAGTNDGEVEIQIVDNFVNQLLQTYSFGGFGACPP